MTARHLAAEVTKDAETMTGIGSFWGFMREVLTGRKA